MKSYQPILLLLIFLGITSTSYQVLAQASKDETFTIENYYKAKWGYADEFLALYKKNHYPLLKKAIEKGDIVSFKLEKSRQHASEDSRWDYRVTLVFKNVQTAFDPNLTEPYKKVLYSDLEKLKKEEQRRFEILLAHWDVEVAPLDPEKP
ncbi:MAG: hypothetical protein ACKOEV_11390 [Cytophagales bacterium]